MTLRGDALLEYVDNQPRDRSLGEIAAQLGMGYKQLENSLYIARKNRKHYQPTNPGLFNFDLGEAWKLAGDWCIVGDVHVPTTDWEFAQYPALISQRYLKRPRKLLVAGDFFNMDNFSSYATIVQAPSWAQERDAAREMLTCWLDTFDEIRLLMGNHDRRLQKFTAGAFEESDILALLKVNQERVKLSRFGYCTVEAGGRAWRVTHPKNYSQVNLTVAEKLAWKYGTNIISHHEHHFGMSFDRYNNHIIINNGWLGDASRLPYVALDDSTSAGMVNGFTVLRDGYPYLFGDERLTDYSKWI